MNSKKTTNFPTLTVTKVDQARLLADPIKLRIIQEMAFKPHTTKQVADIIGEKPTKLYRHVEALRAAGLIEMVAEKPKRGTVEKYFLAVARRFEIHPDLFAPPNADGVALVDELLSNSYSEMRLAMHELHAHPTKDEELQPCFMKFSARASEQDIKELRGQLLKWLDDCQSRYSETAQQDDLNWSGLIAFYADPAEK